MGHGFIIGNLFITIKVFKQNGKSKKRNKIRNKKKVDSLLKITFDFIKSSFRY